MPLKNPKVGKWVVFAKEKYGDSPGQRAQQIAASEKGDAYNYIVDKYWIIQDVTEDGILVLKTRTGKLHRIRPDDPGLRFPTIWERIFLANRFPNATDDQSK